MQNIKLILAVIIIVALASVLFKVLWKIGLIVVLVLGIIYLYQRVVQK